MPLNASIFPKPPAKTMPAPASSPAIPAAPLGTGSARSGWAADPAIPDPTPLSGPKPPATPAAPEAPKMVPAYIAKAMERQRAKEAKETMLVPEPAATPAAAAPTDGSRTDLVGKQLGAPAPAAPTGGARTDLVGQQLGAPPPAEPTAGARTDLVGQKIGAPPETPATPATTAAAPVKTPAEQAADDLLTKATEWLNATEDPAWKAKFNDALLSIGSQNLAQNQAMQAKINADPSLRGQGAGNALMSLIASQQNMSRDQLIGNLSIESAKHISDLNRYGFEAVSKLNEIRKSEDEKNLSSYGSVLDEMIKGGSDEATLEAFFNTNIKPLLPGGGAGMTLDMFRNEGTRAQLLQGHRSETQRLFREAIVRGDDLATIRQLMDAAYTPEQITAIGNDWMKGKSLEEVNAVLKEAGYDEIADLADLIGNEDMIGEAKIIADATAEANKKPYQDEVDDTLQTLADAGYELTPEMEADVKAYIIRQSLPGADTSEIPPWQDEATAHLYESWPLPGQTSFNPGMPDQLTSPSVYARNEAIGDAWERYVRENPDEATRLTREDWYNALPAGVKDGSLAGGALSDAIAQVKPPKPKVEAGDKTLAAAEYASGLGSATDKFAYVADNIDGLVSTGMVLRATGPADLPTTTAGWDDLKKTGTGNTQGMVEIGGQVYQIFQEGSHVVEDTKVGKIVKLRGADGKMYVMKVNTGGKYEIPVGVPVPYDEDAGATKSFAAAGLGDEIPGYLK